MHGIATLFKYIKLLENTNVCLKRLINCFPPIFNLYESFDSEVILYSRASTRYNPAKNSISLFVFGFFAHIACIAIIESTELVQTFYL